MTDDRGRYRLHGLPPGEYFVVALNHRGAPLVPSGTLVLRDADVDAALKSSPAAPVPRSIVSPRPADPVKTSMPEVYAPVYFPGTARAADAIPIALLAGDERDADIRLEPVKTARVEGALISTDGTSVTDLVVRLLPAGPRLPLQFDRGGRRIGPDGRFSFDGIAPGTYTLQAGGIVQRAGEFASAVIEVAGSDVSGIQLTLRPALAVNARLAFEGSTPPPMAGHRVPVRGLPAELAPVPQVSPTDANGAFNVSGLLPGRYVIDVGASVGHPRRSRRHRLGRRDLD
jgi:hypothetical protein